MTPEPEIWLPVQRTLTAGEVSLYSLSPVLQVWIQLLHYIQIATNLLVRSNLILLIRRPAVPTVILPPVWIQLLQYIQKTILFLCWSSQVLLNCRPAVQWYFPQRWVFTGGSITVGTAGLQINRIGFDQTRRFVAICMNWNYWIQTSVCNWRPAVQWYFPSVACLSLQSAVCREQPVQRQVDVSKNEPDEESPNSGKLTGNEVPDLKPNEVVLKKEVIRTEFAPYLIPGDLS